MLAIARNSGCVLHPCVDPNEVGFVTSVVCLALVVLPGLVWCILTPHEQQKELEISSVLIGAIITVAGLAGVALVALLIFLGASF